MVGLHQSTPERQSDNGKSKIKIKKFSKQPFWRPFFFRKPHPEAVNTWKMAKTRICMNLFNISNIGYLTFLGWNYTRVPPERQSDNGKSKIKIKNSPRSHFQYLSFSENRIPRLSIREKWQRPVFAWIYLAFQTLDIWRQSWRITLGYPPNVIATTEKAK